MNTATIKRANGRTSRGGGPRRPSQRRSWLIRLLEALPLDEQQLHKIVTWVLGLILLAMAWVAASFFGLPAMLWDKTGEMAGRAGLQVAKVNVRGTHHMDQLPVNTLAFARLDQNMLTIDLEGLRAQIMRLGWVKDARVSRRFPDTLVVDIVERKPVAVWQHEGQFNLVDNEGVVLNGVDPRTMPDLPLVVGPDANHQAEALAKLMNAAPSLKPMLAGAAWVGNRRWDLQFQSGEILALPEGEAEAAAALVNFAHKDGVNRLLGRGFIRFDMRDPTRFVARLAPGRSMGDAAAVPDAAVGTGALQPVAPEATPSPDADAAPKVAPAAPKAAAATSGKTAWSPALAHRLG